MNQRPAEELTPILPVLLEVLGTAGVGVVVLADHGEGLVRWYANEPVAVLHGYPFDELIEISPLDLVVPEQRPLVAQLSAAFVAGQPVPHTLEIEVLRKDGSRVALEVALGHLRLPDGVAYVMAMRDAGAPRSAQLSLLEADRFALVGALSAGFAHQINNPLTSVLLNLRSLRKLVSTHLPEAALAPALQCLDDLALGSERIASNVRALQTLATRGSTEPLDLSAVVSAALRLAAPTLEPHAHVIRNIAPVPAVQGEESRVGQAVLAMLLFSSSGFEAETTTSDNRIVVAVEERGGDVVVEVSDNGRDLSPEEVLRAFDPFFRSPGRGAGAGVGLGVARSVATTLGGGVTLEPRDGGGAVITMRLPAAPAAG